MTQPAEMLESLPWPSLRPNNMAQPLFKPSLPQPTSSAPLRCCSLDSLWVSHFPLDQPSKTWCRLEAELGTMKSPGTGMTAVCSGLINPRWPLWPKTRNEKHHLLQGAYTKPSLQQLCYHQVTSCLATAQTPPPLGSLRSLKPSQTTQALLFLFLC